MEPEELLSIAETTLKKVKLDEAECYVSWEQTTEAKIDGGIPSFAQHEIAGIGIRGVIGKKVGFTSVSSIDPIQIERAAQRCFEIVRKTPEDPDFHHLPDPVPAKNKRASIWDENIASYDSLMKDCRVMADKAKSKRIVYVTTNASTSLNAYAVANTRGIGICEKGTGIYYSVWCKAKSGNEEKFGCNIAESRQLIPPVDGALASEGARECLGGRALEQPEKGDVVFDPFTLGGTGFGGLLSMLDHGISAREVQEHRSALKGKIEEPVASKISIIDDGRLQSGLRTRGYDDEGVPTTRKSIIEDGILKTYLYDSYCAHREGMKSSGNGMRIGMLDDTDRFSRLPGVKPTNYVIEPTCQKNLEGLIEGIDHGLLVRYLLMGVLHANQVTGDFSIVAPSALMIDHGEIAYPLKPVTLAGNFYEMLKQIKAVGKDKWLCETGLVPSMVAGGITYS